MDAVISGQAGIALLLDGDKLASLHVGFTREPVSRHPSEVSLLLAGARDLEVLEEVDTSQVILHLELASTRVDALHLAMIILDKNLSERTRRRATQELDELLAREEIREFLERILYAKPLPASADLAGALTYSPERVSDFLHELQSLQSTIVEINREWELSLGQSGESEESRVGLHAAAARGGKIRDLVLKAHGREKRNVVLETDPLRVDDSVGSSPWEHPSPDEFEDFIDGRLSSNIGSAHSTRIVRHLLAGCVVCSERLFVIGWHGRRLARLLELHSDLDENVTEAPDEDTCHVHRYNYDAAFAGAESALDAFFASSRPLERSLEELLAELSSLDVEDQIQRVSVEPGFANPLFVRYLVERSHASRYEDPDHMYFLALIARFAAEACTIEAVGSERRLADVRARAWGQFANSLRVRGQLVEAEDAFAAADRYCKAGTGDPLVRAHLLEQTASLRQSQRRFEEAIEAATEAGDLYREIGDTQSLASSLVQKALATIYSGDSQKGVTLLNRAIPLIDHDENPHLLLAACHNLVQCYIDLGRPEQGLAVYFKARELYSEFKHPLILLRAGWQEGQLLRDLGHLRAAEAALLRVREGFLSRRFAYEVAVVSLDLAAIYVRLGKIEELKQIVTEALPIFRSLRIGREALGTLIQLQKVADQEQQALELIRSVANRLMQVQQQNLSK